MAETDVAETDVAETDVAGAGMAGAGMAASSGSPAPGALAGLAGQERSRLLRALAERERLERVLQQLAGASTEPDPAAVAQAIATSALELSGARLALVALPELLASPAIAGPDARLLDTGCDTRPVALLRPVWEDEVVRVDDAGQLDPQLRGFLAATADGRPLRSLFAMPLELSGQTRGLVLLAHHRANAFSDRQLRLVGAVVGHLSRVIGLSEAITAQSRIATALQESLLPPLLPRIEGVDLAARYRPSGSGNLVGGDFYDVFFDGGGGWYLLLGDASGIGPEAAGLAGIARYTARALARSAPPPREILAQINTALLRAAPEGRFCTAVLAHLEAVEDPRAPLVMRLASAGHPPTYVQRGAGAVEPASGATGALLGVLEVADVAETALSLLPGDAAVFYTDGVTEARDARGEHFGEEGIVEVLRSASGRSAEGVARRIERAVTDHRRPGDSDDVAVVVVRRPPPPGPAGVS